MTASRPGATQPNTDGGSRRGGRALAALGLVVLLVAVVVGWLWWSDRQYREAQAATGPALQAAWERAVAVLSYDHRSIDRDLDRARSGLTAPFLDEFNRGALVVAPTARQRQIAVEARVVEGAIVEARPDEVVVLLFVNQNSRSTQSPDVQLSNVRVQLTMAKVDDRWLVSEFRWV